jgi:MED6 mediator sub complex component
MSMIDTQYIDIQWLKTYGLGRNNVLDYFYTSPFFDLASNNNLIRTQGVQPDHLVNLTGLEYAVDPDIPDQPNLFVIRKQYRESPKNVRILEVYYCLDGIIYQSPELLQLVRSRINKTSHYLDESFQLIQSSTSYSNRHGRICWAQEDHDSGPTECGGDQASSGAASTTAGQVGRDHSSAGSGTSTDVPPVMIREFPSFSRVVEDLRKF